MIRRKRSNLTTRIVRSFRTAAESGSRHVHVEHSHGEPSAVEHSPLGRDDTLGRNPTVRRFEVRSPRVHPAHDGVTIAHLTDLHVHRPRSTAKIRHAVRILNELEPDFVALTGDYVRYSRVALPHLADCLAELRPKKIATLGNHDHWLDAEQVASALRLGGCHVLENDHATVELRGAPLHIVGIDDRLTRHDDAQRAFARVPSGGTRVVLSHIAEVADEIGDRGGALVLSGHTHGGQVKIPGFTSRLFRRMGRRYLSGFFKIDGQMLYVSHGIGASVPIRIGAPAEVCVFVLRSAAALRDCH